LRELNDKQREAVLQTEGPVLILAGAGSGKTRTLTHRIAYLIKEKKVNPQNILAVTFTNKAAGEMAERVRRLLGVAEEAGFYSSLLPVLGTFHSVCVRILRKEIEYLGYKKNFVIYDDQDQKALLKRVMKELSISDKEVKVGLATAVISSAKNKLWTPADYGRTVENYKEELLAKIFKKYQAELKKADALDFDDLIMKTVELFETFPKVLEKYQEIFRYLMVDEYQDTNRAQYRLLKLLAEKYRNLCVVGDDYQSVYRWRGADIENILNFERDYPEAKVILLEQNYRSTQIILDAADSVIRNNKWQKRKKLWTEKKEGEKIVLHCADDEEDEARLVVEEIEKLNKEEGIGFEEMAVLYRTNAQSRVLEEYFMKFGLPYKIVGGLRFYQRKEIKDIVAYLYFLENPKDKVSLLRIINEPKRGLGVKTVEKILLAAEEYGGDVLQVLQNLERLSLEGKLNLPASKLVVLRQFAELILNLKKRAGQKSLKSLVEDLYRESGYEASLANMGDEGLGRQENILELLTVAESYDNLELDDLDLPSSRSVKVDEAERRRAVLRKFLEDVTLISQTDRDLNAKSVVPLMTIHSAKGLEFKVVFVVGMEEGLFPHSQAGFEEKEMEEERRLCYVAITRAKEKLYLLYTRERAIYGSRQTSLVSRFIEEIDKELLEERLTEEDEEDSEFIYEKEEENSFKRKPIFWRESGLAQKKKEQRQAEKKRKINDAWRDGDKVKHKYFGEGIVVSVDEELVTVAFAGVGVKKLAKAVVELKKV